MFPWPSENCVVESTEGRFGESALLRSSMAGLGADLASPGA
jgi:hypothetical protein